MYETYYDILQQNFGEKNLHLYYMDTDSFKLSVNTKDVIKVLKNLEDIFDFSNLRKIMNFLIIKTRKLLANSN